MTLTLDTGTLPDGVREDLDRLRLHLIRAREEQQRKDTPAARALVQLCLHRMDAVLDLWNATVQAGR